MAGEAAGVGASAAGSMLGGISPMGWLSAGSSVLGAALGGGGGPAYSSASAYTNVDHSGWTVSTGKGQASAVGAFPWYVWVVGAAAAYWYFRKGKA